MRFRSYWNIVRFNFSKTLAYPLEVLGFVLGRLFVLGMLVLFWSIVGRGFGADFSLRRMIAYFLIIGGLNDLIFILYFHFGDKLQVIIKEGEISNYLIKPVNTIIFLISKHFGERFLMACYSAIALVVGIFLSFPIGFLNLVGFLGLAILSFFISIGLNLMIGTLSFYTAEATAFRHTLSHLNRLLSGSLIPLTYFSGISQKIILATPFAAASFSPVFVLQNNVGTAGFVKIFIISLFWAVLLMFLALRFWKKAIKQYDGVGI